MNPEFKWTMQIVIALIGLASLIETGRRRGLM